MKKSQLEHAFNRPFKDYRDNWKACCPFHDERTPSFFVHKDEFIANCFGCGTSGRVDVLLSRYAGVDVSVARKILEIEAGELIQNRLRRKEVKYVPTYYPESWLAPFKKEIHKYVAARGFTVDILRSSGALYDATAKRQVFPHRDREGNLIGAIGRDCTGQGTKWYFYWGYDKGQGLWSPNQTRERLDPLILVEGVFDVLWLHQHGYRNVAATLGVGATTRQLQEIKEHGERIIIGFDRDDAGTKATGVLYERLRNSHHVAFAEIPEGRKDWQEMTKEEIDAAITNAKNPVERKLCSKANFIPAKR